MATEEQTTHAPVEEIEPGVSATAPVRADGIAAALALDQAGNDPELAAELRRYLQDQRRLADLADVQQQYLRTQMEHLHEQRHLTLVHMRYQHFSDWLSAAWKVLLVILGTGVLAAAGWLVWGARQDKGLVMEAFHVPEDLAAKGYTGTVVAERVLDHLKVLQAESTGIRASSSYSMNWGESLQVEIPETGVSLGELKNFLHENLGNQTRIRGEVVHTDQGIAIHVRAGEQSGERIDGAESELDALTEQAAEKIYASTQPYRYASVLVARGRSEEAMNVLRALSVNARFPASERAWAYGGLTQILLSVGDIEGARQASVAGIRMDPELFSVYVAAGRSEMAAGRDEAALQYYARRTELVTSQSRREDADPVFMETIIRTAPCIPAYLAGDGEVALEWCAGYLEGIAANPLRTEVVAGPLGSAFHVFPIRFHDIASAHATIAARTPSGSSELPIDNAMLALGLEEWAAAAGSLTDIQQQNSTNAAVRLPATARLAYATARAGELETAEKLIDATPTDCYPCLRTRGQIAALKNDWLAAERWFSEAAKQGPSLPFANTEWGQVLLDKGDSDRAIAQFEEAVKRQAHFADPYQYWGEALLAKGDARGAIDKFEQAVKYAPKWGRIHIQWGAALKKLGRDAEAKQKFSAAEAIDLVPSERALLSQTKGV